MKTRQRDYSLSLRYFMVLLLVVVPLFSFGTANHGLWSADEPRVAEIGREMAETGNWAVPMLNQKPFLEHPPLYYACLGAVFKLTGAATDGTARIPSALFSLGGVIVLFILGNLLFGPRIGFISGLVMASSAEYFRVAHWVMVDSAVTFFVISAMTLFIAGYLSQVRSRKIILYVLCYGACSFGFLVKGFIALGIPGLAILTFLILDRNLREILRMRLWLGVLIFVVISAPWFMELYRQGGQEYLTAFLVHNHLQRFLAVADSVHLGHRHPFYYYLTEFPAGFLPWSLLLVPAFVTAFSPSFAKGPSEKNVLFAKCWFITGFVVLSLAATKRIVYLLPIFAPVSLMVGIFIDRSIAEKGLSRLERIFSWLFGLLPLTAGMGALAALFFSIKSTSVPIAPSVIVSAVLASCLCLSFSLVGLIFLWRNNIRRFWGYAGGSIFVLALFSLVVVMPVIDQHKSFRPFCKQISALVPIGATLYGYQADETLRGAVPFYTGRYMKEVEEIARMVEIAKEGGPVYIVTRDSRGKIEKELIATGAIHVLYRQDMGTDRSLLLFRSP